MKINLTSYECVRQEEVYLVGKYLTDIYELRKGLLLVSSYSECSYYLVNLETHQETLLCKGFSPYALTLSALMGTFDLQNFPYLIAKEDDNLVIIHATAGFVMRVVPLATHN